MTARRKSPYIKSTRFHIAVEFQLWASNNAQTEVSIHHVDDYTTPSCRVFKYKKPTYSSIKRLYTLLESLHIKPQTWVGTHGMSFTYSSWRFRRCK
jgi:hypothetical protein